MSVSASPPQVSRQRACSTPMHGQTPVGRESSGCHTSPLQNCNDTATGLWWCDMDAMNQHRVEKIVVELIKPLESRCCTLEARCEELACRFDACEPCIDETNVLRQRLIRLEEKFLAATDKMHMAFLEQEDKMEGGLAAQTFPVLPSAQQQMWADGLVRRGMDLSRSVQRKPARWQLSGKQGSPMPRTRSPHPISPRAQNMPNRRMPSASPQTQHRCLPDKFAGVHIAEAMQMQNVNDFLTQGVEEPNRNHVLLQKVSHSRFKSAVNSDHSPSSSVRMQRNTQMYINLKTASVAKQEQNSQQQCSIGPLGVFPRNLSQSAPQLPTVPRNLSWSAPQLPTVQEHVLLATSYFNV